MGTHDHDNAVRSIRSRHIRSAAGVAPIRLTQRDVDLLTSLVDFRILTTTQIQRLFFRSLHRSRKRLFKLWQHGVVDRVFRPVALGESPSEAIYTIAAKGARLLARARDSSEQASAEVTRRKKMSPFFLEHTLAVSDFRIALMNGCSRTSHARLLFWRQGPSIGFEQIVVDQTEGGSLVRVPIVADGLAGIEIAGRKKYYFVEVDRGTVPLRRWRRRYAAYVKAYRDAGLHKRLGIDRFSVLILAPNQNRLTNLFRVAKPYSRLSQDPTLFKFAVSKDVVHAASNVWTQPVWLAHTLAGQVLQRLSENRDVDTSGHPLASE